MGPPAAPPPQRGGLLSHPPPGHNIADVYPHETAISHIRRLLDQDFTCSRTHETVAQFRVRVGKVVDHMNSDDFQAKDGTGLPGLCRSLRARCERVLADGGRRLPH